MGLLSTILGQRTETADCEIEVSHTFDSLHAHVRLRNGDAIRPGDAVIVHGAPIKVPYGEVQQFERSATIHRAGWLEQAWTRLTGDLEFMELCEFSFSEEAEL